MEQIYTQIRRYIDENRQPMLNLWRDLVNTESGTTQIDGVNAVCSIPRDEERRHPHPCPRHSELR